MKRLSLIGFAVAAFLMLSSVSHSEEQPVKVNISGYMDAIGSWNRNIPTNPGRTDVLFGPHPDFKPGGDGFDKQQSVAMSRGRFRINAITDKVRGTAYFEIDAARWGGLKITAQDQRNQAGAWGGDAGAVEMKNLFINFDVPFMPVPVDLTVGIQPMLLRPDVIAYNDGTGITANINLDPANVKLMLFKAIENQDWRSDDVDIYAIDGNRKIGGLKVGALVAYYNMRTYPLNNNTTNLGPPPNKTAASTQQAAMTWLGLYADGKVGPFNITADFDFDIGKVQDVRLGVANDPDVDYRGWITRVKADYPVGKYNFGVVGMYATGSDLQETSDTGRPGTAAAANPAAKTTKVTSYVNPPGAESGASDESIVFYGTGPSGLDRANFNYNWSPGNQVARGTYGGTWFAKLYGSYRVTPSYKVTLLGLYIGDTSKNGNTIGDAVNPDGSKRDDRTIGWEFGLVNDFQVYKNLQFRIGAGYLVAGDAMAYRESATSTNNIKPADPWAVITKLVYTF